MPSVQQGLRLKRANSDTSWTLHTRSDGGISFFNSTGESKMLLKANGDLFIDGSLNPPSDINKKESFLELDKNKILSSLVSLPISGWKYKNSDDRHIGPMAQDFYKAFGLGAGDKTISTVDADGVALLAIQALNEQNVKLLERVEELEKQIDEIKSLISN